MKTYKHIVGLLSVVVLLPVMFSGCAGYRLGTMLPKDIQTVYVPTFVNGTEEPLIEVEATRAVIRELQIDGSLKVTDESNADSVLLVRLTEYKLTPLNFERTNRRRANQYRVFISANVYFQRRSTGETIVRKNNVEGDTEFDFAGDLITTKRNALPDVTEDLAHDIVELIVEAWN